MKRADDLEREKASLKDKLRQVHADLQTLVEWQTANLVLHGMFIVQYFTNNLTQMLYVNTIALAEFAWDYVSMPDKAELCSYNMFDCKWNLQFFSLIATKFAS